MTKKFIPFTCPDPGQQMTRLINEDGQGCPDNMIIRELVFNALDACARALKEDPSLEGKQSIKIHKHHVHKNKLCVTNYGGDYFSKKIAQEHFGTVAHTIHTNNSVNKEYDDNKGKGAKISYLPKNREGLKYYSYLNNEMENVMFQAATDPSNNQFGFGQFICPETEEATAFPYIDDQEVNHDLSIIGGTEAICMGDAEEEDTWATLNKLCSRTGKSTLTGWPIFDELSSRFWETPEIADIQVDIFDGEGEIRYSTSVRGLKDQYQYRSKRWSFELPESDKVLKNTKVHVCMVKQGDKGIRFSHEKPFVGFAYKKEVYFDWRRTWQSCHADLSNCGIYTNAGKFNIIVEIDSKHLLHSTQDRGGLVNLDPNEYFLAIKENLPEEISDILASMQDNTVSSDNINDFIKKNIKNFLFEFGNDKEGKNDSIGSDDDEGTLGSGRGSSGNGGGGGGGNNNGDTGDGDKKQRKRRKSSSQKLKDFTTPEFKIVTDGEKAVRFETVGEYCMYINSEHPLIQTRIDLLQELYPKFSRDELKKEVINYTCLNSTYQIFKTQRAFPDHSLEEKELYWTSDILSNNWTPGTDHSIKARLNQQKR